MGRAHILYTSLGSWIVLGCFFTHLFLYTFFLILVGVAWRIRLVVKLPCRRVELCQSMGVLGGTLTGYRRYRTSDSKLPTNRRPCGTLHDDGHRSALLAAGQAMLGARRLHVRSLTPLFWESRLALALAALITSCDFCGLVGGGKEAPPRAGAHFGREQQEAGGSPTEVGECGVPT